MVTRRGCWEAVCTRGAWRALLGGPSTSPLERTFVITKFFRREALIMLLWPFLIVMIGLIAAIVVPMLMR